MKKTITAILATIVAAITSISVNAQTPTIPATSGGASGGGSGSGGTTSSQIPRPGRQYPPGALPADIQALPMITSIDALKAHARERTRGANVELNSRAFVYNPQSRTFVHIDVAPMTKAEEIKRRIKDSTLRFELAEPREEVRLGVFHIDEDWNHLFGARTNFFLVQNSSGNWVVPQGVLDLEGKLDLAPNIPITISNLTGATIIARDSQSNILEIASFSAWNGRFFYPSRFAGKIGDTILSFEDERGVGSSRVFDIPSGVAKEGGTVRQEISVNSGIKNYIELPDNTNVVYVIPEGKCSPLVALTLTAETNVLVYANTLSEVARCVFYRKAGSSEAWKGVVIKPVFWTKLTLGPGTYFFSFVWDTFGKDEECQEQTLPDGGKA